MFQMVNVARDLDQQQSIQAFVIELHCYQPYWYSFLNQTHAPSPPNKKDIMSNPSPFQSTWELSPHVKRYSQIPSHWKLQGMFIAH